MTAVRFINDATRRLPPWTLYIIAPLPAAWWLYLGVTGTLSVEPIKALEHRLGEFALQLLIAGLAITPLRRFTGLSLIRFRRAIGVVTFFYVLLHLMVWLFLDVQNWGMIWTDILKRPYVTIGMLGFVLLIPLAATSNNLSIRRMGPVAWRRLHRLVYPAVLLGGVHYMMLVKGWQLAPMVYLALIGAILLLRLVPNRGRAAA